MTSRKLFKERRLYEAFLIYFKVNNGGGLAPSPGIGEMIKEA